MTSSWAKASDSGLVTGVLAIDLSKAFDCIFHHTIFETLKDLFHVSLLALKLFKSYLSNRRGMVQSNSFTSEEGLFASGVPQGSVLGPLLFIIFINYIGSNLNCPYMMFADDLKLYLHCPRMVSSTVPYQDQPNPDLQANIDNLYNAAISWGLEFAADKCMHLRFKRPAVSDFDLNLYHLGGLPIKMTNSHKDLKIRSNN